MHKHISAETETGATRYVSSGQITTGSRDEIITSSPLGSCVAVVAYDTKNKIGGMAHVMLPGKSYRENRCDKNKYVCDGINNLLSKLYESGAQNTNIKICLIGGANVLRKKDDLIAETLVVSVLKTIGKKKMKICASSLGGFERRSARLDIETGTICFTIGESAEKVLWEFNRNTNNNSSVKLK
ncbi:MAG: chemoreceptor glutamine deamidase CheD [bacterium]|nr:MAG: chemoreceptor glutamine deamidase CheD [bacterium]